jgi:hypothetical protein
MKRHVRIDRPRKLMPPLENLSTCALGMRKRTANREKRRLDKEILILDKKIAILEASIIVEEAMRTGEVR